MRPLSAIPVYFVSDASRSALPVYVVSGRPWWALAVYDEGVASRFALPMRQVSGSPKWALPVYLAADATPIAPIPGGGGGVTLPDVSSATRLLDLQADALALADGDPVSTWADASGLARDFTQSGAARPIYHANDGGFPSVDLHPNIELWMLGPDIANDSDSMTIFIVSAYTAAGVNFGLSKILDGNSDAGWYIYSAGSYITLQDTGDNNQADVYGAISNVENFHVLTYELANRSIPLKLYQDSILNADGDAPPSFSYSNAQPLRLGIRGDMIGVGAINGLKFRAVMIYEPAPNATDRAAIEAWLAAKYGV